MAKAKKVVARKVVARKVVKKSTPKKSTPKIASKVAPKKATPKKAATKKATATKAKKVVESLAKIEVKNTKLLTPQEAEKQIKKFTSDKTVRGYSEGFHGVMGEMKQYVEETKNGIEKIQIVTIELIIDGKAQFCQALKFGRTKLLAVKNYSKLNKTTQKEVDKLRNKYLVTVKKEPAKKDTAKKAVTKVAKKVTPKKVTPKKAAPKKAAPKKVAPRKRSKK